MILDLNNLEILAIDTCSIHKSPGADTFRVRVEIDGFQNSITVGGDRAARIIGILKAEIIDQLNSKPE